MLKIPDFIRSIIEELLEFYIGSMSKIIVSFFDIALNLSYLFK